VQSAHRDALVLKFKLFNCSNRSLTLQRVALAVDLVFCACLFRFLLCVFVLGFCLGAKVLLDSVALHLQCCCCSAEINPHSVRLFVYLPEKEDKVKSKSRGLKCLHCVCIAFKTLKRE
jgi:hypothetical protein